MGTGFCECIRAVERGARNGRRGGALGPPPVHSLSSEGDRRRLELFAVRGERGGYGKLVPEIGIEPTRPGGRRILSPLRLPVPPLGHGKIIAQELEMPVLGRVAKHRADCEESRYFVSRDGTILVGASLRQRKEPGCERGKKGALTRRFFTVPAQSRPLQLR